MINIQAESDLIAEIQKHRTAFLDNFFVFLGYLGTHVCYLTFAPLLFWSERPEFQVLGRALVFFMCAGVYVTGILKDLLKLPRPVAPAVQMCEKKSTLKEYGFPSTHTTHSFSISFFTAWFLLKDQSMVTQVQVYLFCSVFVALVGFSRIYTGMHSFSDVLGGLVVGMILLYIYLNFFMNPIEELLILDSLMVPISLLMNAVFLMQILPDPGECPCIDDSAASVGASTGVLLGGWLYSTFNVKPSEYYFQRVIFGTLMLFLWRIVAKSLFKFQLNVFRVSSCHARKVLVYAGIGTIASFIVPLLI